MMGALPSARCGSLVQSGEVRGATRKEVSASNPFGVSPAMEALADAQPLLMPLVRSGRRW
jgi:hypothetical protein